MKSLILLTTILVITSFQMHAQNTPEIIIEEFFEKYKSVNADEAMDYIFNTNPWKELSVEQIEALKSKLNSSSRIIGKIIDYKLISKKAATEDFLQYTYIVKYEKQPLRFIFLFYHPSENWQLLNLSFDDELLKELR